MNHVDGPGRIRSVCKLLQLDQRQFDPERRGGWPKHGKDRCARVSEPHLFETLRVLVEVRARRKDGRRDQEKKGFLICTMVPF